MVTKISVIKGMCFSFIRMESNEHRKNRVVIHKVLIKGWDLCFNFYSISEKVQVGNDQEKAQSEKRFPLQKSR